MSGLLDTLGADFFQRALVEAVLVGALGGVVGVHVLFRKLSFYVAGLSHATLPGIVIAAGLGVSTFLGGWLCGLVLAVAVVGVGGSRKVAGTNAIGVLLTGAFAVGVLLLTAGVGDSSRNFTAFLVGSILTVDQSDITITAVVAAVVIALCAALHKELIFSAFDRTGATAAGYRVTGLDLAMLVMVSVVTVTVIPAVGTLLSIALLTVPALSARQWNKSAASTMVLAAVFGSSGAVLGLLASSLWEIAAGGAIALCLTGLFALSAVTRGLVQWATNRQRPTPAITALGR